MKKTTRERFEEKYATDPSTGCWVWTGSKTLSGGYGQLSVGGVPMRAHRFSYELHNGPIPEGLMVCHRCDVPSCVNWEHLFLGTHADNMYDRGKKRRTACGDRHYARKHPERLARGDNHGTRTKPESRPRGTLHYAAKLTADNVRSIRANRGLITQKNMADAFGVSRQTVSNIQSGKTWTHVK